MPTDNARTTRRQLLGGGAAMVGISLVPDPLLSAEAKQLNFYNWDTYIGETTLADFTKATGIKVKYDLYADNDELFAKLKSGNPGYDLIVPSSDYVEQMLAAKMLVPLDHAKIPNIRNIDPQFMDGAFDPGRKYSLPYMWGTIGIGYRKSAVKEVPDTWKWLYESDKYSGRIAMLGSADTVFQMGLKYIGKSLNDWSDENIARVEKMIVAQKKHIAAFAPDNGQDLLLSGEVDLVMEWNGDILQVMGQDKDLDYVVPKEGGLLWQDTFAIPKGAPHPDAAHAMINFIFDARNGQKIAETIQYGTPNAAAKKLCSEAYRNNPAIFPPPAAVAKSEAPKYPGQEIVKKRDAAWTRIKAAG